MGQTEKIWAYNGIPISIASHVPDDTMVMIENGRKIIMSKVVFDRLRPHLGTDFGEPAIMGSGRPLEKSPPKSRYDLAREE